MKSIDRLLEAITFKGLKMNEVEEICGFSKGYFSTTKKRGSNVGSDVLESINKHYPDINIDRIISGKGSIIIDSENEITSLQENAIIRELNANLKLVKVLEDYAKLRDKTISKLEEENSNLKLKLKELERKFSK